MLKVQPTGWEQALEPGDFENRVLGAIQFQYRTMGRDVGVLDTAMRLGEPPLDLPDGWSFAEIVGYLDLHFWVSISMDEAAAWETLGDVVTTIRRSGPKGMPEQVFGEIAANEFIVAIDPDGEVAAPFETLPRLTHVAPLSNGRVIISAIDAHELLGRRFGAFGLTCVIEEPAETQWTYARVKVMAVRHQNVDRNYARQADREIAIATVESLDPASLHEPGVAIIEELPNRFLGRYGR